MRSDRLLSLLLLLQARNPRSARELGTLLEVSQRTIYRDVEALSMAGVPVYAERGSTGGIALAEGYRQSLAHFSADELHALFVASAQPLTDLDLGGGQSLALHKIAGALPEAQRRNAEKARERILLDQHKWYHTEQPGVLLATLRHAVWEDLRVQLRYRDRAGAITVRVVDPLGLVSKAGVWYVVAREPGGELRSFRAERIVEANVLGESFARPPGFVLEAYWSASTAAVERPPATFEVTVRVRGDVASLRGFWDAEVVAHSDDAAIYRVRFSGEDMALFQVVAWGGRVEVLEPAALREAAIERAREILDLYGAGRQPSSLHQ